MKIIGKLVSLIWLVLNLAFAILWLLASLGMLIDPTVWPIPSILAIGYEWLVIVNLVFGLSWLVTKRKVYSVLFVIFATLTLPATQNTIRFTGVNKPEPKEGNEVRVMTYNTLCLGKIMDKDQTKILDFIGNSGADIVCLQEIRMSKNEGGVYMTLRDVKERLGYEYSYIDFKKYNGAYSYGMAVFSRYPLVNKQTIRYESNFNQSDRCDVVIGSDTIRLINNHLESNRLTTNDLQRPQLDVHELQSSGEKIEKKLSAAYPIRVKEVEIVRKEIDTSPYRTIVCGDMNDVPVSYCYRQLSKGLGDAYLETNKWSGGHTFVKRGIGIRIDYIFHSKSIVATDCRVIDVNYSDHKPVMATFRL